MKKLFAFFILMTVVMAASGQNPVTDFTATLRGRCASFDYSYSLSGQFPLSGSGQVTFQGDSFRMEGDDLRVFCDGTTRWTVDTASEECYIESVNAAELDIEANPALLVSSVDKAFKYQKSISSTFNGQKVSELVLSPVSKTGNISSVSLFLTSAKKPAGAIIKTSDGTLITIVIRGFELGPQIGGEKFRFDTKQLGKSYIITDLRQ